MKSARAAFALAALAFPRLASADTVSATVDSGPLVGVIERGVRAFKGIPYAKAPVGPLRFQAPQPPAKWKEPREATAFGAACPQVRPVDTAQGEATQSEDCLTLNVWAPATPGETRAPVMVWIHGGGNTAGASSRRYYDGSAFARDGVILVSINYRLGRLGFFAHPALTRASKAGEPLANYGLLDQIEALSWVKRNIAAFGGDPKNVTAFGESAGGEDLLTLITMKGADGLFQKAIVESGGGWKPIPTLSEAEDSGKRFASTLLAAKDAEVSVEALRGFSTVELTRNQDEIGPIVDGRLLTTPLDRGFADGRAAHIPLLIGTNSDEGSLASEAPPEMMLRQLSTDEQTKARALYGPSVDDPLLARSLFRDLYFTAPARWIARRSSRDAPVFLYRFNHLRRSQRGRVPGSAHGSEIPYVFDSWHQSPSGGLLAPEDLAFATAMHACWVSFARTGTPACASLTASPYKADKDEVLQFGTDIGLIADPLHAILDFVDAHFKR